MFSNTKAIINNFYLTQLTFYSLNKRRIILCKILFEIKKKQLMYNYTNCITFFYFFASTYAA